MEGYYTKNLYGTPDKNSKGRLRIEAMNITEFNLLLEKAEKEACQLNETLSKLRRFELEIDFSVEEPTSVQ